MNIHKFWGLGFSVFSGEVWLRLGKILDISKGLDYFAVCTSIESLCCTPKLI